MAMRHHHSDSGLKPAADRKVTGEDIFGEPSVIWPQKEFSDWSKTDEGTKWQHGSHFSSSVINGASPFEGESPCKGMGDSCVSNISSHPEGKKHPAFHAPIEGDLVPADTVLEGWD